MRTQLKFLFHVLLILFMIAFNGCRMKNGYTPPEMPLEISGITPAEIISHTTFVLNVIGQGFNENSVIMFNGQPMVTHYINQQAVRADIEAALTAFPLDLLKAEVPVWVINKNPSTGETPVESSRLSLTVWPMPKFSDPVSVYMAPTEVDHVSQCRLVLGENNRLFLLWRETTRSPDYVPSYATKLCVSSDGGQTWAAAIDIPVTQTIFYRDGSLFVFPDNEAMNDGWLKYHYSPDNGITWNDVLIDDLRADQAFNGYQVCMDGTGRFILVYAQTNKYDRVRLTTLHSADGGGTWELKGENFSPLYPEENSYVYGYHLDWMTANDTGGIVLGCVYDSTIPVAVSRVYKSSDGGDTFAECSGGLGERNISSFGGGFLTPRGKLYAAYGDNFSYRVHRLAFFRGGDLGEQTGKLHFFDDNYSMGDMAVDSDGNMYVVWAFYISRSIDGGEEWSSPLEPASGYFGLINSAVFDNQQNLHIARITEEKEIIVISSERK
ncbi:MAG: exo-alpha-sialidase [bacterium]|nr:exo-alpha-sialidase [bacterium]